MRIPTGGKLTHMEPNDIHTLDNTKERRKPRGKDHRQQTQREINKLKELYGKLYFAHAYPKNTAKLLTRSCEGLETHLIKQGLPKHRVEDLFNQALETVHKKTQ
jgi:hypothetical protein